MDDSGAASVRAIMHWQYRTICRGHHSILHNLYSQLGSKTHDYISFYGLRSYGRLFDGGPVATGQVCSSIIMSNTCQEDLFSLVTMFILQVYVHSKIMIIDDCTTLIGSANINDRSLLGSRDSEV